MSDRERKIQPITPDKVEHFIPDEVIQTFNDLISENFSRDRATVGQEEVLRILEEKYGISSHEVFEKGWLDVEGAYIKEGWKVEYHSPGLHENYDEYFVFTRRAQKN